MSHVIRDRPLPQSTPTKQHYASMDFLRGVAALGVVVYHFAGRLDLGALFPRGYLAVDFFFVLSGFVIANAYGRRLETGQLSITAFYATRLIRLMPMVVIGTLIAFCFEFARPNVDNHTQHIIDTFVALAAGILLIPTLHETTLEKTVFPLNGVIWSLFFEIAANAVYPAYSGRSHALAKIAATLVLSGGALVAGAVAFHHLDLGNLPIHFWYGFPRVMWSFCAGLLIYQIRDKAPGTPFYLPVVALLAVLFVPRSASLDAVTDTLLVFLVIPAVVFLSIRTTAGPALTRASTWSGELSFPLYAIHYPFVRVLSVVGNKLQLSAGGRVAFTAAATLMLTVLAAIILRWADEPIRRRLSAAFVRALPSAPVRQPAR